MEGGRGGKEERGREGAGGASGRPAMAGGGGSCGLDGKKTEEAKPNPRLIPYWREYFLYSSNPRRVGIYNTYTWASRWASIHMGSIYSNIPPQSELPAQRCSRLDNKKANTPRSLNNRCSGVQDWTRRE